jgi:hypothetical protein
MVTPMDAVKHASDLDHISTPQLFYTYFYNHAHRLRLEKRLCIELSSVYPSPVLPTGMPS